MPCRCCREIAQKETKMNWDYVEDKWKQFTGAARKRWGKLTAEKHAHEGSPGPEARSVQRQATQLQGSSMLENPTACCGLAKGDTTFQTVTKLIKWISLPVLLIASVFSRYAATYEGLVD